MADSLKQQEMTKELRSARNMLLVVGIVMFVVDIVIVQFAQHDRFTPHGRQVAALISAGVLAIFVALYVFSRARPRLCLTLGLVIFWAIQITNMVVDPKNIASGIVLKVLFTMALVKGIKSASRAEVLKRELTDVFE